MNLYQLAETVKGLGDDQIKAALQGQSQSIPPYLAMTEMQRRASMREQYEGAKAGKEGQSTVADDLLQGSANTPNQEGIMRGMGQASQMQGIRQQALQPQKFAGGGAVQRFAGGDKVSYGDDFHGTMESWAQFYDDLPSFSRNGTSRGRANNSAEVNPLSDIGAAIAGMIPGQSYGGRGGAGKAEALTSEQASQISGETPANPFADAMRATGGKPTALNQDQPQGLARALPTPAAPAAGSPIQGGQAEAQEMAATKAVAQQAAASGNDPFDALADLLSKSYAELAGSNGKDMALLQTGLAIASGTSPNAVENIAKGGLAGAQAWMEGEGKRKDQMRELLGDQVDLEGKRASLGLEKERLGLSREELALRRQSMAQEASHQGQMVGLEQQRLQLQMEGMQLENEIKRASLVDPMVGAQRDALKTNYEANLVKPPTDQTLSTPETEAERMRQNNIALERYITGLREIGQVHDVADKPDPVQGGLALTPGFSPQYGSGFR